MSNFVFAIPSPFNVSGKFYQFMFDNSWTKFGKVGNNILLGLTKNNQLLMLGNTRTSSPL